MDKYSELGDSLYCYSGTNILKNKLNIRDEQILEQAELELSGISDSHNQFISKNINVMC